MQEETKKCPFCGEFILAQAKKCKFCKNWLNDEKDNSDDLKSCPYCYEKINVNAKLCKFCGSNVTALDVTSSQDIRNSLKSFEDYKEAICLNCGYSGQMGVIETVNAFELRWWLILILILCGVGIPVLIGVFIIQYFTKRLVLECPNCKANLVAKKVNI